MFQFLPGYHCSGLDWPYQIKLDCKNMSRRFFLESEIDDRKTTLSGDQAHHVIHVMRLKPGQEIILFDGRGSEHQARIAAVGKRDVQLEILGSTTTPVELGQRVTIAVALPKGDRQKFLVEKLVELGVSQLIPLQSTRSVAIANEKVLERMKRHVIESSKQCGRNHLMEIEPAIDLASMVSSIPATANCYYGHSASPTELDTDPISTANRFVIAIGPEGGFDPAEIDTLKRANWQPVNLSPTILRTETAAVVAAVLLGQKSRDRTQSDRSE